MWSSTFQLLVLAAYSTTSMLLDLEKNMGSTHWVGNLSTSSPGLFANFFRASSFVSGVSRSHMFFWFSGIESNVWMPWVSCWIFLQYHSITSHLTLVFFQESRQHLLHRGHWFVRWRHDQSQCLCGTRCVWHMVRHDHPHGGTGKCLGMTVLIHSYSRW